MATRKEIFEKVIKEIKESVNIESIKEYSYPEVAHVAITLKENVTMDDMIAVAKIAYDNHDDMQVIEIKNSHKNGKAIPVSNVIEVALSLVTE